MARGSVSFGPDACGGRLKLRGGGAVGDSGRGLSGGARWNGRAVLVKKRGKREIRVDKGAGGDGHRK